MLGGRDGAWCIYLKRINEIKIESKIIKKRLNLSIKDNRDIYLSNREGQKNIGISATYNKLI